MDTLATPLLQDHIMAILFDTLVTFKSVNEILCYYYICLLMKTLRKIYSNVSDKRDPIFSEPNKYFKK